MILAGAMAPAVAGVPVIGQPSWSQLPPAKQQILAPLANEWDGLESWRKKKWIEIADRYPRMTPEEQTRVQQRIKDWVRLSPEERKAAREKYKNVQQASPEHREALKKMWSEYETLPPEEKERLKQSATAKASTGPKTDATKPAPANR